MDFFLDKLDVFLFDECQFIGFEIALLHGSPKRLQLINIGMVIGVHFSNDLDGPTFDIVACEDNFLAVWSKKKVDSKPRVR